MKQVQNQFFTRYINYAHRHPWLILFYTLLLLVPAVTLMLNLRIDAQLDELLPKNTPTIKAMKETNKRFGSADMFTIAIQMDNPVDVALVQDEIKAHMEKHWDDAQLSIEARDQNAA